MYCLICLKKNNNKFISLSTSKGILTGQKAKKYNIGGELLLQIW